MPDYKEIEKLINFNFDYKTSINPNEEEEIDRFFNDAEFIGKLKSEKFERLYS